VATKVINVRKINGDAKQIEGLVYIGRAMPGRKGVSRFWPRSPYCNPFKPNTTGDGFRDKMECVIMFTEALVQRCRDPKYLEELRRKLKGKYLACWCTEWHLQTKIVEPCHGIPLACIAEGHSPETVLESLREVLIGYLDNRYPARGIYVWTAEGAAV
jgi:hypothetical protein